MSLQCVLRTEAATEPTSVRQLPTRSGRRCRVDHDILRRCSGGAGGHPWRVAVAKSCSLGTWLSFLASLSWRRRQLALAGSAVGRRLGEKVPSGLSEENIAFAGTLARRRQWPIVVTRGDQIKGGIHGAAIEGCHLVGLQCLFAVSRRAQRPLGHNSACLRTVEGPASTAATVRPHRLAAALVADRRSAGRRGWRAGGHLLRAHAARQGR